MTTFSSSAAYYGTEQVWLILIDGVSIGYVPLDKGSDVFGRLVSDRKVQLEQDLGHSVSENVTQTDKGDYKVVLDSPTRSYIWSGRRVRCQLELKKLSILRASK